MERVSHLAGCSVVVRKKVKSDNEAVGVHGYRGWRREDADFRRRQGEGGFLRRHYIRKQRADISLQEEQKPVEEQMKRGRSHREETPAAES